MAAYCEIAAQSAYGMFSKCKYLIVNNCQLMFFRTRFLEWEFLSDCAFSLSLPPCTFLSLLVILHY